MNKIFSQTIEIVLIFALVAGLIIAARRFAPDISKALRDRLTIAANPK